jgi:uncharacterized protein YjbI with pentapeptide repeats
MANQEQLEILMRGATAWNSWRETNLVLAFDLTQADLSEAYLSWANLNQTQLVGTNLFRADLSQADLRWANLKDANLSEAYLIGANLTDADLTGADLSWSNFRGADLSGTKIKGARVSNARIGNTIFAFTNLSEVIGLETVIHLGPSSIGIETIYASQRVIPEIFLRGCGLSDFQIETVKLATPGLDAEQVTDITYKIHQLYLGGGIQYYSCFISYNSEDQGFAQRLHDDLQNNSVRCWFAPEDMKVGDQIRPTIDRQIRLRDKLLVILSENSVQSEWVGDEVEAALEEEQASDRLVLFPIRLDDAVMDTRDDWAAKIKRRRHIGDFSNWKDEGSYRKAFERLLRDLKA